MQTQDKGPDFLKPAPGRRLWRALGGEELTRLGREIFAPSLSTELHDLNTALSAKTEAQVSSTEARLSMLVTALEARWHKNGKLLRTLLEALEDPETSHAAQSVLLRIKSPDIDSVFGQRLQSDIPSCAMGAAQFLFLRQTPEALAHFNNMVEDTSKHKPVAHFQDDIVELALKSLPAYKAASAAGPLINIAQSSANPKAAAQSKANLTELWDQDTHKTTVVNKLLWDLIFPGFAIKIKEVAVQPELSTEMKCVAVRALGPDLVNGLSTIRAAFFRLGYTEDEMCLIAREAFNSTSSAVLGECVRIAEEYPTTELGAVLLKVFWAAIDPKQPTHQALQAAIPRAEPTASKTAPHRARLEYFVNRAPEGHENGLDGTFCIPSEDIRAIAADPRRLLDPAIVACTIPDIVALKETSLGDLGIQRGNVVPGLPCISYAAYPPGWTAVLFGEKEGAPAGICDDLGISRIMICPPDPKELDRRTCFDVLQPEQKPDSPAPASFESLPPGTRFVRSIEHLQRDETGALVAIMSRDERATDYAVLQPAAPKGFRVRTKYGIGTLSLSDLVSGDIKIRTVTDEERASLEKCFTFTSALHGKNGAPAGSYPVSEVCRSIAAVAPENDRQERISSTRRHREDDEKRLATERADAVASEEWTLRAWHSMLRLSELQHEVQRKHGVQRIQNGQEKNRRSL